MNQRFIVIDGKTYKSVDEMPENIRKKYEEAMRNVDRDRNGTPDLLEKNNLFAANNKDGMPDALAGLVSFQGSTVNMMNSAKIIVDGQPFDSLDQLPPEIRAKYEQAMGAMDANRNGIPDFMEGMLNIQAQTTNSATANIDIASPGHASSPFHAQDRPKLSTSAIEPESSGGWMLALAGAALVGLCLLAAAAGAWYFFLR